MRAVFARACALAALSSAALVESVGAGDDLAMYIGGTGGARVCPRGHFCSAERKFPCPSGTFNGDFGRNSCTKCQDDEICAQGSIAPRKRPTNSMSSSESRLPSLKPQASTNKAVKHSWSKCPGGKYLDGDICKMCPQGHYCPGLDGSIHVCPPGDPRAFCPLGSVEPLFVKSGRYVSHDEEVICERGYFVNELAVRAPCPAGRFGSELGETRVECEGACAPGYHCPEGSITPFAAKCTSPQEYCPSGSGTPIIVNAGYYSSDDRAEELICPVGWYCVDGIRYPCPAGTYGIEVGLASIDQCIVCPAGYKCHSHLVEPCGSADLFCPKGDSFAPRKCVDGKYTIGSDSMIRSTLSTCSHIGSDSASCSIHPYNALYLFLPVVVDLESTRSACINCPKGHFCANGLRHECPPGVFGAVSGLSSAECSGVCLGGSYCPAGSTSNEQHECPPAHFCPVGSGSPHPVQPGYYISADKVEQIPCEPGSWCANGVKTACAAGKYGSRAELSSPACSGLCPPGWVCANGQASPKLTQCLNASQYCPIGSYAPINVSPGFYTNAERSYQHICDLGHYCQGGIKRPCPAGTYGGELGLDSPLCSGSCAEGYFCPSASVSQTAFKCSEALGRTRDAQTFLSNSLRNVDKRCLVHLLDVYPEQFFEFSLLNQNQERDPSLWELAHDKAGLYSVYNTLQWDSTDWAFASNGDPVEYMATGWRPGSGPKTMCMWKKFLTDDIYGLDGMQKQESTNDYFMLGTLWSFRDRIFASSGTNRGTYAQVPVSILKGDWVFYCLTSGGAYSSSQAYVATPKDALQMVWQQDDNGNDRGIASTATHLSNVYGKTSTGSTDRPMYHTPSRHALSKAHYGGILHWNAHLTEQQITNAYQVTAYFYPGHEGYNGQRPPQELQCGMHPSIEWAQNSPRNIGPLPSVHFEKDAIGVYHPIQNRIRQLQYPDFNIPFVPETKHNSPAYLFCPKGSKIPSRAKPGHYTDFDSKRKVATKQMTCPKAHYCHLGIKYPCPETFYGDQAGLTSPSCSGTCPEGHYCPQQSTTPLPCPPNSYAPKKSKICQACPAGTVATCNTSNKCCQNKL